APLGVGLHRGARRHARLERLLPDDAVLLLLRVRGARARDSGRVCAEAMRVVVLTTSYPSPEHPVAGNFVETAVEGVRARGVEVSVVSPASFAHFGIAYGDGIAQNLRRAPWKLPLVPGFLAAYARTARRAARDADLVHAHWIPSGLAARATGKPYVLQVWGTDIELARRAPMLVRPLVRGARLVVAASSYLAREAQALGARRVVATRVGGLADLGEGAVLVDADGLGAAIGGLLADPARREQLGSQARATAEASFSPAASTEALLSAYEAAVSAAAR